MATVDLITEHTRRLPESVQREILNFVEFLFNKYNKVSAQAPSVSKRQAGLHPGSSVMADDFDAPLPDFF
ncbi:DUF2281 domain-containing protein [Thiothrix litoralis]|jgi:hypothetical protein|uniref:DUF2281 domain-containing protein n=1 Tax=Thiothrix litoralis TaxID=2891210 RepID=A0ABX7WTN8_9GAMM|nr:DUF2281 domain-containing protein [Thiothrix litoralis]QTR46591.1 DUF2281 domain-containing protein [Thiothrix litoralis]